MIYPCFFYSGNSYNLSHMDVIQKTVQRVLFRYCVVSVIKLHKNVKAIIENRIKFQNSEEKFLVN